MFAGEGDAFRTNRRFKLLAEGKPATRLSTAFDSVTLYGRDPDDRAPTSTARSAPPGCRSRTLDDMKALYDGFDLTSPTTSVSMTINGPAPTILAYVPQHRHRPAWTRSEPSRAVSRSATRQRAACTGAANVRGTVQADILKEDQGQNTCIFSTEFACG